MRWERGLVGWAMLSTGGVQTETGELDWEVVSWMVGRLRWVVGEWVVLEEHDALKYRVGHRSSSWSAALAFVGDEKQRHHLDWARARLWAQPTEAVHDRHGTGTRDETKTPHTPHSHRHQTGTTWQTRHGQHYWCHARQLKRDRVTWTCAMQRRQA